MPDPDAVGGDDAPVAALLADAERARLAGDQDGRRIALVRAFRAARSGGDDEAAIDVARRLPGVLAFGPDPGQVPALLHEALLAATLPGDRAWLAAALARAWVYGSNAERALVFADEAEQWAAATGDPVLIADALEAALVARWGPDDYAERVDLAARLADAAAHLTDVEVRLSALLWRLTTAWEGLDIVSVQRQLRALDLLAAETGSERVAWFAASRRAMHAYVTGDLEAADAASTRAESLGATLGEPDAEAIRHSLRAHQARLRGDHQVLVEEAAGFEAFGMAEGIPAVLAEAATLWLAAGDWSRAGAVLDHLVPRDLDAIPRDVDFLLIVASIAQVAAAIGREALAGAAGAALVPYAGRAVLNAGAVTFAGVVDEHVARALAAAGDPGADRWRAAAANAYRRIGATWWLDQVSDTVSPRGSVPRPTDPSPVAIHLHPTTGGLWAIGTEGSTIPARRGFSHLRLLLQRPGVEVPAAELVDAMSGHGGEGIRERDLGPVLDATAIAAYRRRLAELDIELDEAGRWADEGRLARLQHERDALIEEITAATGLGGRARRPGSTQERARVAVRKAITTATDQIAAIDPATGRLLRDTIRTGASCSYDPDPARPVRWILDDG